MDFAVLFHPCFDAYIQLAMINATITSEALMLRLFK
jgi:hypothetical protein